MFSKINSFSTRGIDGYRITVEVDVSNGLPSFVMVGYLAEEVREAQERVRTHFGMRGFAAAEADHGQFIASWGAERGNGV